MGSEFDDEELRLAIAMSLSVGNGGDGNGGNGDNNNNDNGDSGGPGGEEPPHDNEEKKPEDAGDEEREDYLTPNKNDEFVTKFAMNCLCSRALTNTYDRTKVFDELTSPKRITSPQRGFLDVADACSSGNDNDDDNNAKAKKTAEDNDIRMLMALPSFTRLVLHGLNETLRKGEPNVFCSVDFAMYVLTAYKNVSLGTIRACTKTAICSCISPSAAKAKRFFEATVEMLFEVLGHYSAVLEVDDVRDALLSIVQAVVVANNSAITAATTAAATESLCVLPFDDADELKELIEGKKVVFMPDDLSEADSRLKDEVTAIMNSDDEDHCAEEGDEDDVLGAGLALFERKKGFESVVDYVMTKLIVAKVSSSEKEGGEGGRGRGNNGDDDDKEIEKKRHKESNDDEEKPAEDGIEVEQSNGFDNDDDDDDGSEYEDFYFNILSFMKFFSNVYAYSSKKIRGIGSNDDDDDNNKADANAVYEKLLSVYSAVVLGNVKSGCALPPFGLFLVLFKIISDSRNTAKQGTLTNMKTIFARSVIKAFVEASSKTDDVENKWAQRPLCANTFKVLLYAVESLERTILDCRQLYNGDSPAVNAARDRLNAAVVSANNTEFLCIREALEQDVCAVLSAAVFPAVGSEETSLFSNLIQVSSLLSAELSTVVISTTTTGSDSSSSSSGLKPSGSDSTTDSNDSLLNLGLGSLFDIRTADALKSTSEAAATAATAILGEDDLCKTLSRIYVICKQMVKSSPSVVSAVVPPETLGSLIEFAQRLSPVDNKRDAESKAIAGNIRDKKNYQRVVTAFRNFTQTLLTVDSKVGGHVGEAIARKVYELFPLFGPLECVIMTTRYWALKALRPGSSSSGSVSPVAAEIIRKFVETLAERAATSEVNDCWEVTNYERAEEILFIYNCCLNEAARTEITVLTLEKVSLVASMATLPKCTEGKIALARLIGLVGYFSSKLHSAPTGFMRNIAENILDRRFAGSPAEEALPCKMNVSKKDLLEHTPGHLEFMPYFFYAHHRDVERPPSGAVLDAFRGNLDRLVGLLDFAGTCDYRIEGYYSDNVFGMFSIFLAADTDEHWLAALLGEGKDRKHKGAILLLLIISFISTGAPLVIQDLVEKSFNALADDDTDAKTAFGLLLFLVSVLVASVPESKDKEKASERSSYTPVADRFGKVSGWTQLSAEKLIGQVKVPMNVIPLKKVSFDWKSKLGELATFVKKAFWRFLSLIGDKNADALRAYLYGGFSLGDSIANELFTEKTADAYRNSFNTFLTITSSNSNEGDLEKIDVKSMFSSTAMPVFHTKDEADILKLGLNIAVMMIINTLAHAEQVVPAMIRPVADECLVLDHFSFANYGVIYDAIINANKVYSDVVAQSIWVPFTAHNVNQAAAEAIAGFAKNESVLSRLVALHKKHHNIRALYNVFVLSDGPGVKKVVRAMLKVVPRKKSVNSSGSRLELDKAVLFEMLKTNGLNPDDDNTLKGIIVKVLKADSGTAAMHFLGCLADARSGDKSMNACGTKAYNALLGLVDDAKALEEVTTKVYFEAIQTVSALNGTFVELFEFVVGRLGAASSKMKVDGEKGESDELVHIYAGIVGKIVRMLMEMEQKKGSAEKGSDEDDAITSPEEKQVENAVKTMAKNMPYWENPEDDPSIVCTFVKTGKNYVEQDWYHCITCKMTQSTGVCRACALKCHKGHKLALGRIRNSFYCDCGCGETSSCVRCKCCAPAEAASVLSAANSGMEVEGSATKTKPQAGLYVYASIPPSAVEALKSTVFSKKTFDVLLEYLSSQSASLVAGINGEGSGSNTGDDSGSVNAAVVMDALERKINGCANAVATVEPTLAASKNFQRSDFTRDVKTGDFSFSLFKQNGYKNMGYNTSNPSFLGYAAAVVPYRREAVALLCPGELRFVGIKSLVRRAGQDTLGVADLPFTAVGAVFHPRRAELAAVFNDSECHTMVFSHSGYGNIEHEEPIVLPDNAGTVLNVFWMPLPTKFGPYLCVVTKRKVLIYDVSANTEAPLATLGNFSEDTFYGAVCVKATLPAAAAAAAAATTTASSGCTATFIGLTQGGSLLVMGVSRLGASEGAPVVEQNTERRSFVRSSHNGIFYSEQAKMIILTAPSDGNATGCKVTVAAGSSATNVEFGVPISLYPPGGSPAYVSCFVSTAVCGIPVIAGLNRMRGNVTVTALGSESFVSCTVPSDAYVCGLAFIDSGDSSDDSTYLLIVKNNSRVGVSTLDKRRIAATSPGSHPPKNSDDAAIIAGAAETAAKLGKRLVNYSSLPAAAPEISDGAVYTMIRGTDNYVIDGDITESLSPIAARAKLREPQSMAYSECGVVSMKRGDFRLRVISKDPSLVITGLQIGIGNNHKGNVPEYIKVFNRSIAVNENEKLCYTVVFTFQEVICAQKYVSVTFGPSKNGFDKVYIDYITPFFTKKSKFGLNASEWPSKVSVVNAAAVHEACCALTPTETTRALITTLRVCAPRALSALPASEASAADLSFVSTVVQLFTAVPAAAAEQLTLLDTIERRIQKTPAFVAQVVQLLLPIVSAGGSGDDNTRARQLCTIAEFVKRTLSGNKSGLDAAFDPVVRGNLIPGLCAAVQKLADTATATAAVVVKSGIVRSLVSLVFAAQMAVASKADVTGDDKAKLSSTLAEVIFTLLSSTKSAVSAECAYAICSNFEHMSSGYRVLVSPPPAQASADPQSFTASARLPAGSDLESILASAKRMSLAGAVQPGHVLKEMLYLAPNTVDFCAMELQSLLHSLLQVPQAAKSPESDSDGVVGRWVPTFYTITQLAVLTIRAASVCRPRRYVAELCQSVVKHLLPAQASAAAFLTKDVLAGLPSAAACCTVLRVAAIATIIRECARPGMAGEAVKWMTESLPEDFPAAVYAFFDGPFLAEYERISRQPASANTTIIGKRSTKCLPASLFRESSGRQQQGGEEGNGGNGSTKSWQPLLADIFTSEEVVGVPAAVSFLYAKRLCNAVLYLVRKAVAVFPQASFEEERWADLIGRCMAQSKLAFAHPQMLRLARSILSTDTELFRRIDSVGQARLATFLEVLSAKTDRFARPPSVEDQARLLELLYAQFSVLLLRPWSWRAHGLTHPKTVPLIYKLALAYVYSRKVRRDIVNLAIILLGSLFDCNDDDDNDGGDNSNKVLNSSAATEIAMDLLDDGGNNNDKDCTLSGGCCNHNDDGCSEDEENRTFGDFIEAFVLNHPSKETRMLAASFVRVLLRSGGGCNGDQKKDVKERVAAVVWSFLEDVTNAPAQSGSEAFMSILPDACNSSSSSSSEGRELDLLTSLDTHTRRIASYPEASAVVFGWAKPKSCPVCLANSPSNAYYSVTGLCTRDMIQILPNGVSFMFSGRSDIAGRSSGGNSSSSGSGSGNVSGTSIMVKEIGVCLPLAREVTLSVAYRPPGGGGGEAKWVTVTKGRGLRRNFVGLGCGVHIAGIKVELAGINAGEEAKLVCPECGAALTSFVCKKCKLFAINMFVIIASECVIPVNSRITSDKDAESENEKLSTALSNVCIPPFSPK